MKIAFSVIVLSLICSVSFANEQMTVDKFPPVVVKTYPIAGSDAVSPTIKEIKVTFSKDMMTEKMWSVMSVKDDMFPELTGEVKFINKRTFVMPVKLVPNKTYAMQFNGNQESFKCTSGHSAHPYLLVFKTK